MPFSFNPGPWTDGVTIPHVIDFQHIAADIRGWGGTIDAGGYAVIHAGALQLKGGEFPGDNFGCVGATWSAGIATITLGTTHGILVGQIVLTSGFNPSGYNTTSDGIAATAVGSNTVSFPVAVNPGTYVSGGSCTVGCFTPAPAGTIASDASSNLFVYRAGAWRPILATGGLNRPKSPSTFFELDMTDSTNTNTLEIVVTSTAAGIQTTNGSIVISAAVGVNQLFLTTSGAIGVNTPTPLSFFHINAPTQLGLMIANLANYASNAAAISGGLTVAGMVYRNGDNLCAVH